MSRQPEMTIAREMAARLVAFRSVGASDQATRAAVHLATDLVAVTLSGSATAPSTRLRAVMSPGCALHSAGESLVYGTGISASALDAAMLNGTAAHAEDFDDFNESFGGHPTVAVLPALLALGEARDIGGRAVIDAYVAGVEAESRLADAVHFHHYEKGWHPTSTLGVFGAAAGAAHLLALDEHATATALSIAASLASGIKANFGADTKPMHAGHCNRSGLMAALLAEQGFTAGSASFEGPQGFFEVYNGAGNYDTARLLTDWFEPPALVSPGVSIKQFPCCGSTHAAIYAAMALRDEDGVAADAVNAVDVAVHPRRLPHTDNPTPVTPLDAKFSVQYVTARALLDGRVGSGDFEGEAFLTPTVRELTSRVSARADDEYAARTDRGFAARVTVRMKDGSTVTREYLREPGRGPGNPMSEAELRTKFEDCAGRVLAPAGVAATWSVLRDLASLSSVRVLTRAMSESVRSNAA